MALENAKQVGATLIVATRDQGCNVDLLCQLVHEILHCVGSARMVWQVDGP